MPRYITTSSGQVIALPEPAVPAVVPSPVAPAASEAEQEEGVAEEREEVAEEAEEEEVSEQPPALKTGEDDLSDLFEGIESTDHDVETDDLVSVSEEDILGGSADMSDLTEVDVDRDIMGDVPRKKRKRVVRIVSPYRRYVLPPPSMGGLRP